MDNFPEAFQLTNANEGLRKGSIGYGNSTTDSGGETICGVARNYNSTSEIWKIVDAFKPATDAELDHKLYGNPALMALIESLYKTKYWDSILLSELKSDWGAYVIYDCHVNAGSWAGLCAQESANDLTGDDLLVVDGAIGPKSMERFNAICAGENKDVWINGMIDKRIARHRKRVEERPDQAIYLNDWLYRCELVRKQKTLFA